MSAPKDWNFPAPAADRELRLRPMTEADIPAVIAWRNQDRVRLAHVYRTPFDFEGERAYYREQVRGGKVCHLIAELAAPDGTWQPFGCVVYHDPDRALGTIEGGLFIGEDFALRRGFGPRLLKLGAGLMAAAGFPRVTARVFTDNAASLRTHEAAGYARRGEPFAVTCSDGEEKEMWELVREEA